MYIQNICYYIQQIYVYILYAILFIASWVFFSFFLSMMATCLTFDLVFQLVRSVYVNGAYWIIVCHEWQLARTNKLHPCIPAEDH